jgi:hypothetical protein
VADVKCREETRNAYGISLRINKGKEPLQRYVYKGRH